MIHRIPPSLILIPTQTPTRPTCHPSPTIFLPLSVVTVKAKSFFDRPIVYELTSDGSRGTSDIFDINDPATGEVVLLKSLDYEDRYDAVHLVVLDTSLDYTFATMWLLYSSLWTTRVCKIVLVVRIDPKLPQ